MTQNPHQTGAYDSSSVSLRAERVVEEARRQLAADCVFFAESAEQHGTPWSDGCAKVLRLASDALLASQEAAPSAQWQPIETAPEMRKVIVFYLNALGKGRTVMACYYRANALEMHDDYADVGEFNEATGESFAPAGWYEEHDSDSPLMPLQESPTHWMPLPSPPAQEGSPR